MTRSVKPDDLGLFIGGYFRDRCEGGDRLDPSTGKIMNVKPDDYPPEREIEEIEAERASIDEPAVKPEDRQAIAWAVIDDGQIKVCTVSDSRRATMVNWLVSERSVMVFSRMTDEAIERMWWQEHGTAQIEYVTITRREVEGK